MMPARTTTEEPSREPAFLDRLDAAAGRMLAHVGRSAVASALLLLTLCGLTYVPGFVNLPPVDRTEVMYAESSREMLASGRVVDPRYLGERERHRPIGTFWAQMASAHAAAVLSGAPANGQVAAPIQPYRLPSLLSVTAAVLLTGLLLRPLIGARTALVAAGLFAVTPIAALQAELGIAESVVLGPAIAAQLALLRLYAARDDGPYLGLALLFWSAQGVAITFDALLVPILSLATLIALYVMDRDLSWLRRLRAAWGVPLMLALGSPWIVALVVAEHGVPFAGLSAMDVLKALGGAQAMKFKAWPLTFTLALLVGLMFAAALLEPTIGRLWGERRRNAVDRFLLAWLVGYLAYLELISSKPALYSVQLLLPAATTAVALLLSRDGEAAPLRWAGAFPAWPGYVFAAAVPALYVAAARLTDAPIVPSALVWSAPAVLLLLLAARAVGARRAAAWVVLAVSGAAVFLATTLGVLMPRLDKGWATEVIARAAIPLAACAGGSVSVVGYREPSAVFTFRPSHVHLTAADWQPNAGVVVSDARNTAAISARADAAGYRLTRAACLEAINVTRGCSLSFTAFVVARTDAGPQSCGITSATPCVATGGGHHKPCS